MWSFENSTAVQRDRHGELLIKEMRGLGQMWDQREQFLKSAG